MEIKKSKIHYFRGRSNSLKTKNTLPYLDHKKHSNFLRNLLLLHVLIRDRILSMQKGGSVDFCGGNEIF